PSNQFLAGAGIRVQAGSSLTLNNDVVRNNTSAAFGGGIYALNSNVKLDTTTIRDNTAADGGGIFAEGSGRLTITNSLIAHNTALDSGGGVFSEVPVTISSSTFSDTNHAAHFGGAMNLGGADSTLTNVTITGNTAMTGGGIAGGSTGSITLLNDTIVFNSASDFAGGVLSASNVGVMKFGNTVVAKNTASEHPDVDNNGFDNNMADMFGNFIGDNTGAFFSFIAGTPNSKGSFVGKGTALLDPLLEQPADNGGRVVLPDGSHLPTIRSKPNVDNNG